MDDHAWTVFTLTASGHLRPAVPESCYFTFLVYTSSAICALESYAHGLGLSENEATQHTDTHMHALLSSTMIFGEY